MTDRRQRRRRRLRRTAAALTIALGLIAVVLATVGGVWLTTDDFQRRVVPVVQALVEQQTGEAFAVDRVRVKVWPPAVRLEGATLFHEPTGDIILRVEEVRAPIVLRGGGPKLGTLTVSRPEVTLHIDPETGLREFRDMAHGGRPLRELPWSRLAVEDARLAVVLPDGEIVISGLDVIPTGDVATIEGLVDLHYKQFNDHAAFAWTGAQLHGDQIRVPALAIPLGAVDITGGLTLPLDGHATGNVSFVSDLSRFDPFLGEPRHLTGFVEADVGLSGTLSAPEVSLHLLGHGVEATVPAVQVPTVTYRFGDVTMAATATPQGIDVESLRVCFRGLVRCADPGTPDAISVRGYVTRDLEIEHASVVAEGISLAHVLRSMDAAPTPWTDFTGDAEITVTGTLNPLRLEGPFDLAVANWRTGDGPIDAPTTSDSLVIPTATARGNLVVYLDRLEVDAVDVRAPRSRGTAHVDLSFKPKGPLDLRADLHHADLADFHPLGASELGGTGTVSGRLWGMFDALQFDGQGDINDFSVIGIDWADTLSARIASPDMKQIQVLDAVARTGNTPYTGDFALGFDDPMWMTLDIEIPDGGRAEDVVGLFLDLPSLTGGMSGTLGLHGPLFDLSGEADVELTAVDLFGERFPAGTGHGVMDNGIFTLDDLRLQRNGATEGLILRGTVAREWALNMELVGDGFGLHSLDVLAPADLPIGGDVSFAARIDNTLFDPAPHGRIDIREARYAGAAIPDSRVDFETSYGVTRFTGKLVGGTVATAGTLGLWGEQPYQVSAALRRFPAHLLYPIAADGGPISAVFSGDLEIDGHFGDTPSPVSLVADIGAARVSWAGHTLTQTGPWHYEQEGSAFELTGIGLQGGITRFTLSEGRGDADGVSLRGSGRVDLDLLRAVAPGLTRSDGLAEISVSATGRGGAVQTVVEADLSASLLRHSSFPGTFEDATGRVVATRNGYVLTDMVTRLGGGTVAGGGRITAEGWVPKRWDLAATGTDVQLQWIDELPPAIGNARLSFDGPVGALLLAGRVDITDITFSDRIDWEDWVVEYRNWVEVDYAPTEADPYFSLDVQVIADRTAVLRNNVADGVASADLRFIGDTSRPGLVGNVRINDGVFFLQDREFRVERGQLSFRDPWTWDPQLDFDLATDIRSRDTRYRVNYLVRGPFSNWRTETRSDPPLAQADINALLWFGATADELEELGELPTALAQGVADFILTDLLITQGRGVREELAVFDRVELVTGVDSRGEYSPDPRILVEKRYSEASDLTLTGELNPVNIDDQLVRATMDLTDGWALSAWYASQQRDRVLSIGGAYGVDVRARWEAD